MTKQHFIAIAAAIHNLPAADVPARYVPGGTCLVDARAVANAFADFCAQQNPKFDRERFLAACLEGPTAVKPSRKSFDRRKGRAA